MRGIGLLASAGLAGCMEPNPEIDYASFMTETGGCGDAEFFAMNPEASVIVHFGLGGIASAAAETGEDIEYTWDLPYTNLLAELAFGSDLEGVPCGGNTDEATVDFVYLGASGAVTVFLTPNDDGSVRGVLHVNDVVFVDARTGDGATTNLADPITLTGPVIEAVLTPE